MSSDGANGQHWMVRDQSPDYRFVIRWPVERMDLRGLIARLMREIHGCPPGILVCNLRAARATGVIDAVAVDALARMALVAGRAGWTLRLEDLPAELAGLIAMMGLSSVL